MNQLAATEIRRLMRCHRKTIRGLAQAMGITMKRVRHVRAHGVSGEWFVKDWLEAIEAPCPTAQSHSQQENDMHTDAASHPDLSKPVQRLYCCCCGEAFHGRQFHNQDTGHGLGPCCVARVTPKCEDVERTYGLSGVHYNIEAV